MKTYTYIVTLAILLLAAGAGAVPPQPRTGILGGRAVEQYYQSRPDMVDSPAPTTRLAASPAPRAIVLLIDFEDNDPWWDDTDKQHFQDLLFGAGEASMRSYFLEVSYGIFDLKGDVRGWYRSGALYDDIVNPTDICGEKNDYGLDISPSAVDPSRSDFPLNVWGIVAEAVHLADGDVNFALYDNDGPDGTPNSGDDDGYVDFLVVVHPGLGAEHFNGSCNDIWSLKSDLEAYGPTSGTTADGVGIGPFVIAPELGEIGVFAHEVCHLLGLPDLYNSETGDPVVGDYCLMDMGAWGGPQHAGGRVPSHLSAPMKYFLGWLEPTSVCLSCGIDSLVPAIVQPSETWRTGSAYEILRNPGGMDWTEKAPGDGEYFLIENRYSSLGFFDDYLDGNGLLIWKVDESQPDNNNPDMRLAEVIQADGDGSTSASESDLWPGTLYKTEFTPYSEPASSLAGGRFSGVAIESIRKNSTFTYRMDIRLGLPKRGVAYAFPNPFTPGDDSSVRIVFVRQPGPAMPWNFSVDIFDVEGNLVRRLEGSGETLDNGTALWDGTDERGKNVEGGLYMYVVESTGETASGVLALRR
ncbi:MAG: M6 family metalloprotease domain-containing protein [bacterium]|jgi:M6 family metalloprotease-like protein